jgi:diguanylate cyclase (GGDEF)-like protein
MELLHLRRLAAVAELALEHADLDELLSQVTVAVEELLPSNESSLILWDAELETFTVSHSSIPGQHPGYVLDTVRTTGGVSRWIVDESQPVVMGDIDDDPFGASPMMSHSGLRAYLGVPLVFNGQPIGVLYALDRAVRHYSPDDVAFMTILAARAAGAIGLAQVLGELDMLARTDDLTGCNNRREFFERGSVEFERESRTDRDLSAIVIDIDHFKTVNDRFGHSTGDEVLAEVASRIRNQLRTFDLVGRLGGEEFAILLPEVGRQLASRVAERIRATVAATPVATRSGPVSVTLTLGVADCSPSTSTLISLLDRADAALYDGKAAGRNRVMTIDDSGPIRHGTTSLEELPDETSPADAVSDR